MAMKRAHVGEAPGWVADEACRRRFFLGPGGADAYQGLSALPPIPPGFDGPDDDEDRP
ncbi:hypothetical protein [Thiomonas sp.]